MHILFKYLNIRIIQNVTKKSRLISPAPKNLTGQNKETAPCWTKHRTGLFGDWERSHIADVRDARLKSRLRVGS
jgi:hypothetical protein